MHAEKPQLTMYKETGEAIPVDGIFELGIKY